MIRIAVTQKHIDGGSGRMCGKCPVALATIEATGAFVVDVTTEFIHIYQDEYSRRCKKPTAIYRTPGKAAKWIRLFDSAWTNKVDQSIIDQCKPFVFTLTEQNRCELVRSGSE